MNYKSLSTIIVLAILSVLGIGTVQFFWFKKAFDHKEKIFNQNVTLSLQYVGEYILNYNQINIPPGNLVEQISSNYFVVHTNAEIDLKILEHLIRGQFEKRNITADFEYAVYDCYDDNLVYGNYVNMLMETESQDMTSEEGKAFPKLENDSQYFGVLFPYKESNIMGQMGIWLFSTLVLLFVFGFFGFSIYILFRQKKLSEMQKDFINNMTHEFKTPLYTIMVTSELLKQPEVSSDKFVSSGYLDIIGQEAQRMKVQIERILKIASSDKDKFKLERESVDLHTAIQKAAQVANTLIAGTKGEIHFELNAKNYCVIGDQMHLENVIYNLVENAIKYTAKTPEILIKTYNEGKNLVIEVKDNGVGIDKVHAKNIFDKFYRIPTGNTHNVKGFGLGLSYVREIIQAHKGSIKVDSEKDKGSTFIIKLNCVPVRKPELVS